jgi:DNA adenine methylase
MYAKYSAVIRPFVKWAGGKRQLLPEIKRHIPSNIDDYEYYEPFLGGGAVFFALQPQKAVINDYNTQLILTYTIIKKNIEELIYLLQQHKSMDCEEYFYLIRNLDRDKDEFNKYSDVEKAARLIYLNKTCYNGLYRVNSQGLFNAPYGKYKNPAICEETILGSISKYLTKYNINILNCDFEEAVQTANKKSFIYFDPPYYSPDNTNFTGYQADGFGKDEQIRLCNIFFELTRKGIKCLLSNSDTKFAREIYNDNCLEVIAVSAKRLINSNAKGRGTINELLIKNWKN